MIMETKKSHNLPSIVQWAKSWRADGVYSSFSLNTWEPGAWRAVRLRVNSTLLHLFALFRFSIGWRMPTLTGERHVSQPVHELKAHNQKYSEIKFNQLSDHPVVLLIWHNINNHISITKYTVHSIDYEYLSFTVLFRILAIEILVYSKSDRLLVRL